MLLLLNPRSLLETLLLLDRRLSPHLGHDNRDVLMLDFDGRWYQLRINDVFTEQNKCVARTWDVFRMLLWVRQPVN